MYVDEAIVREAERRWGVPAEATFREETSDAELAFIRRTQKRGRCHDVTMVIWGGGMVGAEGEGNARGGGGAVGGGAGGGSRAGEIAVIAKHDYPEGAWRPPSGGLEPGESIEAGAKREAFEETGLTIEIERYVLRARVTFAPAAGGQEAAIPWVSHVLEARVVGSGELNPRDAHEIRGATWVTRDDLLGPVRGRLLEKKAAGIRYRVALHDAIFAEMDRRGAAKREDAG